jgi:hypothetical protein
MLQKLFYLYTDWSNWVSISPCKRPAFFRDGDDRNRLNNTKVIECPSTLTSHLEEASPMSRPAFAPAELGFYPMHQLGSNWALG